MHEVRAFRERKKRSVWFMELGRVVFCPREGGLWTVITHSEDGHGAQVKINFEGKDLKEEKNLLER